MPELTLGFVTNERMQRIRTAVGKTLSLVEADGTTPRMATLGETRDYFRGLIRGIVRQSERQAVVAAAMAAAEAAPIDDVDFTDS